MRFKSLTLTLLAPLLVSAPGVTPLHAAIDSLFFGSAFSLGGIHFRVGFAGHGRYGPNYYFEGSRPFGYRGYRCSDRCYVRGPRSFHHSSCRAAGYHFQRYGYTPDYLIGYFGPVIPYSYGHNLGPQTPYYRYPSHPGKGHYKHHNRFDKHSFRDHRGYWPRHHGSTRWRPGHRNPNHLGPNHLGPTHLRPRHLGPSHQGSRHNGGGFQSQQDDSDHD